MEAPSYKETEKLFFGNNCQESLGWHAEVGTHTLKIYLWSNETYLEMHNSKIHSHTKRSSILKKTRLNKCNKSSLISGIQQRQKKKEITKDNFLLFCILLKYSCHILYMCVYHTQPEFGPYIGSGKH